MSQTELYELRASIDQHLHHRTLADLNLEEELLSQYTVTKQLLSQVVEDPETPANQKAQVINSLLSITNQLVKMQTELHTAERVKAIEAACVKAVRTLDQAAQKEFFKRYEDFYLNQT
jgi:F0F1-type ATP synthase delta subunit